MGLTKNRTGKYLANQILRSAISAALNYGEAQAAESKRDFIHKLRIILKELRETSIALKIIINTGIIKDPEKSKIIKIECNELVAIFTKSIKTAQHNQ